MEIYLDLVMLLNFLVDFLLLLGTNRLSGFPSQPWRCAGSALLGSVYAACCLLPGFRFLGNLLWRTVCLGFMGVIAFGCNRSALKRSGVFLLLSMALGGIALSFGRGNFLSLMLSSFGVWLLCHVAFGETIGGREYLPLLLSCGGETVHLTALRDTGNTLRDPITGEQVIVISAEVGTRLTGLTLEQLRFPMQTLTQRPLPGLRLIPYRSVGQGSGMLLGLRLEQVRLGNRCAPAVVAFAPEGIGNGEIYQALAGGIG